MDVTILANEIGHGSQVRPARTCKDLMIVRPYLTDGKKHHLYDVKYLIYFLKVVTKS